MVRLVPGDAGVIFQLQHLLNHGHGIRRPFSLVILVPHGKTNLRLARLALLEDVPLTVFRISKVAMETTQELQQCRARTNFALLDYKIREPTLQSLKFHFRGRYNQLAPVPGVGCSSL